MMIPPQRVFDEVREVRMKVDEFKKQMIAHLVKLNSWQAIVFTTAGRPPYCLKCKSVGLVRQRCPRNKTFASVVVDMAESGSKRPPLSPPLSPPLGNVVAGEGTTDQSQQGPMEAEGDGSLKRVRDSEQDSSWIKPNMTAKSRAVGKDCLSLSNHFTPIMSIEDLVKTNAELKGILPPYNCIGQWTMIYTMEWK